MTRRRITGSIVGSSRPTVREEQASAPALSAGVRDRRRVGRRELSPTDWLREAAWQVRGMGRTPRWRV
jgi:hypothetical protein